MEKTIKNFIMEDDANLEWCCRNPESLKKENSARLHPVKMVKRDTALFEK